CLFFFNDTATTEIYTLSLHDALPISYEVGIEAHKLDGVAVKVYSREKSLADRKSTRLNSSHANISYAVFCLEKTQEKMGASIRGRMRFSWRGLRGRVARGAASSGLSGCVLAPPVVPPP